MTPSGRKPYMNIASPHDDAVDNAIWSHIYNHPAAWQSKFAPLSLPDMLFNTAAEKGDAPAIDFMGRKYSYTMVADAARRVAKGLQQMGIGKGDHVGLFLPNVPHYVAAYYGAMATGATMVNFSPLYTADELAHQVEDSGTTILFTLTAAALLPTALKVLEQSSLKKLIVGSVEGTLPPVKSLLYRAFKRKDIAKRPDDSRISRFSALIDNDGDYAPCDIVPERDIALLQYTGGTTGTPKGAMLSHQNLTSNARQVNMIDPDHDAEDRILGVLPFFHVFANTCVLNRTILNGGEMIILPRFDAGQALAAIGRTKVTSLPGVPTMYQALLDHPDTQKTDFSSLRACISGGAPLPNEVKAKFEAVTGAKVVEGYGLTESSGVVSCNPYEGLNKVGSIGHPVPATLIRLVDKEDPTKSVADGEPGELIFTGPQVMKGYWNRPDADAKVFIDGFLRTGDVAQIDDEGYVKIVDRIKDMISVGGFKVFPSQIEEILYQHADVKEALIIGVEDDYLGERPKAFITLEQENSTDGDTVKAWLNPQLGKHERVIDVVIRKELPKTLIGKLDRKTLREQELGKA